MGSCGSFLNTGGFKTTEWHALENKVEGYKVLVRNDETKKQSLPYYSNTPATTYLQFQDGKFHQLREYFDDRSPKFDIDFAEHHEKSPYLHVHYYINGIRQKNPVRLDKSSPIYKKYEKILKEVK